MDYDCALLSHWKNCCVVSLETSQTYTFGSVMNCQKQHIKLYHHCTSISENMHEYDEQGQWCLATLNGFFSLYQMWLTDHGLRNTHWPQPPTPVRIHLQAAETPGPPTPPKTWNIKKSTSKPRSRKKWSLPTWWLTCTLKSSPALTPLPSLIGSLLPKYSTHCRAGGP